jgi:hypothetical protein
VTGQLSICKAPEAKQDRDIWQGEEILSFSEKFPWIISLIYPSSLQFELRSLCLIDRLLLEPHLQPLCPGYFEDRVSLFAQSYLGLAPPQSSYLGFPPLAG